MAERIKALVTSASATSSWLLLVLSRNRKASLCSPPRCWSIAHFALRCAAGPRGGGGVYCLQLARGVCRSCASRSSAHTQSSRQNHSVVCRTSQRSHSRRSRRSRSRTHSPQLSLVAGGPVDEQSPSRRRHRPIQVRTHAATALLCTAALTAAAAACAVLCACCCAVNPNRRN